MREVRRGVWEGSLGGSEGGCKGIKWETLKCIVKGLGGVEKGIEKEIVRGFKRGIRS